MLERSDSFTDRRKASSNSSSMDKRYIFYRLHRRFKDIFIISLINNRDVLKIKLIILIS